MTQAANAMRGNARWYPCGRCKKDHPSVTTLLGMMASPALMGWLAKNGTAKLQLLKTELIFGIEAYKDREKPIIQSVVEMAMICAEKSWIEKEKTDFWKSGKQIGLEAADEGIKVDAWIEAHFKRVDIDRKTLNDEGNARIDNFLKWKSEHRVEVITTQETFANCKLDYAGTADWVGRVDNELTILDWKRSGKVYSNHVAQCWSYALADESQHGDRLYTKIGIGSLGKIDEPITFFKRNDFPGIELIREVMIGCGAIFKLQQGWEKLYPYKRNGGS